MIRRVRTFFGLLALLLSVPAAAQPVHQFRNGEPAAIHDDTAYLLFRTDPRVMEDWFEFRFVREVGPPEGPAAPPLLAASHVEAGYNIVKTDPDRVFAKTAESRTFLIAVPPGSYFLAAVGYEQLKAVGTCLCMGTVRFDARPGLVTDLGHLLASLEDRVTSIPELAGVTNPPTKYRTAPMMVAAAVRPAAPGSSPPPGLANAQVVPADYRAVGKFPNYFRTMISRLNPVPGVLDYERDRVIDVKAR